MNFFQYTEAIASALPSSSRHGTPWQEKEIAPAILRFLTGAIALLTQMHLVGFYRKNEKAIAVFPYHTIAHKGKNILNGIQATSCYRKKRKSDRMSNSITKCDRSTRVNFTFSPANGSTDSQNSKKRSLEEH